MYPGYMYYMSHTYACSSLSRRGVCTVSHICIELNFIEGLGAKESRLFGNHGIAFAVIVFADRLYLGRSSLRHGCLSHLQELGWDNKLRHSRGLLLRRHPGPTRAGSCHGLGLEGGPHHGIARHEGPEHRRTHGGGSSFCRIGLRRRRGTFGLLSAVTTVGGVVGRRHGRGSILIEMIFSRCQLCCSLLLPFL